mmetsp:Transcript_17330/g.33871  ORF Transcript_17330/g.33871 Transcript_17330/m.33871 type:complete len:84 (+) Transcript_17330:873-1124(+)
MCPVVGLSSCSSEVFLAAITSCCNKNIVYKLVRAVHSRLYAAVAISGKRNIKRFCTYIDLPNTSKVFPLFCSACFGNVHGNII